MTFFKMSIYARSGRGPATRILTVYFCTILVSTLSRPPAYVIGRQASSSRCWFPDGARRCARGLAGHTGICAGAPGNRRPYGMAELVVSAQRSSLAVGFLLFSKNFIQFDETDSLLICLICSLA